MPLSRLKKKYSSDAGFEKRQNNRRDTKLSKKEKYKKLFNIFLKLGGILAVIIVIGFIWLSRGLPSPNQLINREVAQSTKIYDRSGENVLYEISGDQKRTLVALKDMPSNVKNATIAIEDKNFYKHGGFSIWAMARTMVTNVIFNRSAGGSTLTQQFIKNAVLTPEKKITRKIKELILSQRLENRFSKDEILQMYLNEIPYGSNAYGIQAASQKYFGKNVQDLNLSEAATLAAMIQTPSRYSPYGPNKDLLLGRKNYVLTLMAEQGYISKSESDEAKKVEVKFKDPDNNMTAPHFVMYVKAILAEKYGEKTIEQGGLKIYTTLDLVKQKAAEEAIKEQTKNYATKYGANNAALVSIDPKTGQILAMVGSKDYFDDTIDGQVNIATSLRQPGSSMKPIVYAALFEKGYTPATILYDVVTNFSTDPANPYTPHNYDLKERGPVSIRQALAGSLNIPAVKAIYLAGINNVLDLAESLGYTSLSQRNRFGLSLVLGGAEVQLLEHTNAYSAFARDGQLSSISSILKVVDKNGKTLEEYQPSEKKVLDSQIARLINSVLTDNNARTYIFGAKNYLTLADRPVAAKTGTTNDYHDAWTIGYTPSLVTGVWVGNSDNKEMKKGSDGSILAAPIWRNYMAAVLTGTPVETFKAPDDYKKGKAIIDGIIPSQTVLIDKNTGLLATSTTSPEFIEEKNINIYHDILYYVDKDNPLGPVPTNPGADPQFSAWENAVQAWAVKNASSSLKLLNSQEFGKAENIPTIKITNPKDKEEINNGTLNISIDSSAKRGISRVEYYLNNNLWETQWGDSKDLIKEVTALANGINYLKVRVCDDVENCAEDTVSFNLTLANNINISEKNSLSLNLANNKTTLTAADFPLSMNLEILNINNVAKLGIYMRSGTGDIIKKSQNLKSFTGSMLISSWDKAPAKGIYYLYAEMSQWSGETIKSEDIKLTIN
ncbi:MAG: PBP1A family penicillin-binding protein [Patescibacteria group bacterium]